ncbi:MAG: Uma2 family endonuclease [Chloroflexota bacterium]|nr:Uma2 family endonuclease [Chloroflexota bacterium]
MAVQPTKYLFTVDEYERLGQAGILGEDSRVELIEGEIIQMNPIGGPHASTVDRLTRLLVLGLGDLAIVRVQSPIRIRERNEPQPDLALLRPRADFYATGHPTPADVLLVVEVEDTTVEYDTRTKAPLYARAGIPELWVVDLPRACVVTHREPSDIGYAATRVHRRGEVLRPLAFPDLAVPVDDILG